MFYNNLFFFFLLSFHYRDKTFIRKQQFLVSKSLQDNQNNSRGGQSRGNNVYSSSSSMRPHTTSSSTPNLFSRGGQNTIKTNELTTPTLDPSNFEMNDNYFMPKRTILRPDGASLIDIYNSKRDDTWGKIIKAQYKEDVSIFLLPFYSLVHCITII